MKINGHTRLAAVVAKPIKHSISPFIHNTAFEKTAVNGVYLAWEIEAGDLEATVANIRRYDMFGINLSMPYKQEVIQYLDELAPSARLIGAVNTVVNKNGTLIGYNTDGKGFFKSLPSFAIQRKKMTILGAGGAATAIIAQAALDQAEEIFVFTRQTSYANTVSKMVAISRQTKSRIQVLNLEDPALLQEKITQSDLLVNGTSVGMDGESLPLVESIQLPAKILVADVIYKPFETPFLKWARSQKVEAVNGLGMLLYQAAEAFELWTGQPMPCQEIWQQLEALYK
ncbi:shikimate 5-dehydrogenase [Streptococcus cristatus]|uniref:Shikimate dehydrogenase (NADP(+)) n=2 Tax=Streptococcus cristatus TaxID=45634 RepID=A0A512A9R9_STRCR|nr:shikimate dehydrogenase [Streptococcus cristatus]AGK70523.1 shikimate 5-dehydrogenase [Streptococcus cristatus AS 1.3089]GEN96427.1 shikimate dehydrogenase (NADP(+)) [Streptococcus cristatus]SQI47876.1 shikimate 5-dehydrogenase [Streptococcus cristatus]